MDNPCRFIKAVYKSLITIIKAYIHLLPSISLVGSPPNAPLPVLTPVPPVLVPVPPVLSTVGTSVVVVAISVSSLSRRGPLDWCNSLDRRSSLSRGSSSSSCTEHGRARDRVLSDRLENVEKNTGRRGRVSNGKVKALVRNHRASIFDRNLHARGVMLRAPRRILRKICVGFVESNDLGTEEVVAWSEASGEDNAVAASIPDETSHGKLAVGETVFGELGPDGAVAVCGRVGNVDKHGALVCRVNNVIVTVVVEPFKVDWEGLVYVLGWV